MKVVEADRDPRQTRWRVLLGRANLSLAASFVLSGLVTGGPSQL